MSKAKRLAASGEAAELTDPYWDDVYDILYFNQAAGYTNPIIGEKGVSWVGGSGSSISTAQLIEGTGSIYFDGNYARGLSKAGTIIPAGQPYTIEAFVRLDLPNPYSAHCLWSQIRGSSQPSSEFGLYVTAGGYCRFYRSGLSYSYNIPEAQPLVGDAVWTHVAESFDGSTTRAFVGGVLAYSFDSTDGWLGNTSVFRFGGLHDTSYNTYRKAMKGHMDAIRITRNHARYTEDFSPPAVPYPLAA